MYVLLMLKNNGHVAVEHSYYTHETHARDFVEDEFPQAVELRDYEIEERDITKEELVELATYKLANNQDVADLIADYMMTIVELDDEDSVTSVNSGGYYGNEIINDFIAMREHQPSIVEIEYTPYPSDFFEEATNGG